MPRAEQSSANRLDADQPDKVSKSRSPDGTVSLRKGFK